MWTTIALYGGCIAVAWFLQNCLHELAHLVALWVRLGKKPKKLIPWPHKYEGRWYWARCESGAYNLLADPLIHSAPLWVALFQMLIAAPVVLTWVATGWPTESPYYLFAFAVAPLVDAAWWWAGRWLGNSADLDRDYWRWFHARVAQIERDDSWYK